MRITIEAKDATQAVALLRQLLLPAALVDAHAHAVVPAEIPVADFERPPYPRGPDRVADMALRLADDAMAFRDMVLSAEDTGALPAEFSDPRAAALFRDVAERYFHARAVVTALIAARTEVLEAGKAAAADAPEPSVH